MIHLKIDAIDVKPIKLQWKKKKDITRWFQTFFMFTPIPGKMIQFDLRIFFRWVGSTTN